MQDGADRRHRCIECNRAFAKKSKLVIHMRIHTGEKPYSCTECNKSFATNSSRTKHLKVHSGEKTHVCHICDRAFAEAGTLKRHVLRHKGERTYVCKICDKSYVTNTDLASHLKRHSAENTHVCHVCDRRFLVKQGLKKHMSDVHLKIKRFTCSICKKEFAHKYSLKKHEQIHCINGENIEHICNICNSRFRDKKSCTRHFQTHLPKTFICSLCGEGFISETKLNIHLKKVFHRTISASDSDSVPENQIFVKEEPDTDEIKNYIIKEELDIGNEVYTQGMYNDIPVVKEELFVNDDCDSEDIRYASGTEDTHSNVEDNFIDPLA